MLTPEPVQPRNDRLRAAAGGGFGGVIFCQNQLGDFQVGHGLLFQIPEDAITEDGRGGHRLKQNLEPRPAA